MTSLPQRPLLVATLALACLASGAGAQDRQAPHLRAQGTATQLIVDGQPFLIRGGELGNSSASSLSWLAPHWKTFRDLRLNTIVAPVYWDLVEAEEGRFVDGVWQNVRWLNGDQTHQGRHIRLVPGRFAIQRVKLYRYR